MNHILPVLEILAVYFVFSTVITLGLFIKIEHWKAQGITRQNMKWWESLILFLGIACDVIYNYTSGSLVLLQLPREGETMYTYHLTRIVQSGLNKSKLDRYRFYIAKTYCTVLEYFDVNHCREKKGA